MLRIKRVYEPAALGDGYRVLVDRLWPRGLRKADLVLDAWLKEVAPSGELRKRFGHRPEGWDEFRRLYLAELRVPAAQRALEELASRAAHGTVTLLFAARDPERNNAAVLREELARRTTAGHAHP
jgi:uncharacterized protein YeaO (DUF488 family)